MKRKTMGILMLINLIVSILILVFVLRGNGEFKTIERRVNLKSLQLKEKAIDIQMQNVQGYVDQVTNAGRQQRVELEEEDNLEEERKPIGYAK